MNVQVTVQNASSEGALAERLRILAIVGEVLENDPVRLGLIEQFVNISSFPEVSAETVQALAEEIAHMCEEWSAQVTAALMREFVEFLMAMMAELNPTHSTEIVLRVQQWGWGRISAARSRDREAVLAMLGTLKDNPALQGAFRKALGIGETKAETTGAA